VHVVPNDVAATAAAAAADEQNDGEDESHDDASGLRTQETSRNSCIRLNSYRKQHENLQCEA